MLKSTVPIFFSSLLTTTTVHGLLALPSCDEESCEFGQICTLIATTGSCAGDMGAPCGADALCGFQTVCGPMSFCVAEFPNDCPEKVNKECPHGVASRNPNNDCEFDDCPDLMCGDNVCVTTQVCTEADNKGECANDVHDVCNENEGGIGCGPNLKCDVTSVLRSNGDGICKNVDEDVPQCDGDGAISICSMDQICTKFNGTGECGSDIGAACDQTLKCGLNLECDLKTGENEGFCVAMVQPVLSLIAGGEPCDVPEADSTSPCAQGVTCDANNVEATCECKQVDANSIAVCTVTSSDVTSPPKGCKRHVRYGKQN